MEKIALEERILRMIKSRDEELFLLAVRLLLDNFTTKQVIAFFDTKGTPVAWEIGEKALSRKRIGTDRKTDLAVITKDWVIFSGSFSVFLLVPTWRMWWRGAKQIEMQ